MVLKDLLGELKVISCSGDLSIPVTCIAYDSRKALKGSIFVCIEGHETDGHKFAGDAVENGASALIVQKNVPGYEGITVVKVENTRYALAHMANIFYNSPSTRFKLIGVTGTNGKTTTTYFTKSILEKTGEKVGLIGTIAIRIGDEMIPAERTTPESLDLQKLFSDMVEKAANSVVMEVSSHSLELHRVDCSDFDIGIFTNLTRDHLDFHITFDNYLNAKAKLFKRCKYGLVNIDDSRARQIIEKAECKIYTYGIDRDADIRAENIKTYPDSVEYELSTPWGRENMKVSMPGRINVYNSLAAAGAALLCGCTLEDVKKGLLSVKVPGRSEVVYTGRDFTVIIDYAHTPDGLENILNIVKGYAPGRVVSVFGCGGDRDRAKRPIMGEISGRLADFTIITSDNPRTEEPDAIINEIEEGIKGTSGKYIKITNRREAIRYAIENALPGDVVALAGKGHETYQIFNGKTIHFDEREVVQEILEES